jgi:hypothetical protein
LLRVLAFEAGFAIVVALLNEAASRRLACSTSAIS